LITFVQGNLFDSSAQVLTNTVNTVGVMGKGIALEFKRRYPAMFASYQKRCSDHAVHPGVPYLWENDASMILNFPTKDHWRGNSKLEYIESGLKWLATSYQELGIHTIAMPPLGCGNGGLNWREVRPLMERYLAPLTDLEVFVYEPIPAATMKTTGDDHATEPTPPNALPKSAAHANL